MLHFLLLGEKSSKTKGNFVYSVYLWNEMQKSFEGNMCNIHNMKTCIDWMKIYTYIILDIFVLEHINRVFPLEKDKWKFMLFLLLPFDGKILIFLIEKLFVVHRKIRQKWQNYLGLNGYLRWKFWHFCGMIIWE